MTDFLPTQEPGPGPTDAPLATYQSYSAYTTSVFDYTTTITRIAYDPAGNVAPSLDIETQTAKTTSIGYKVINLPLLYTGPFPAPPLGTLFTTAGEVLSPTPTTNPASAVSPTPTTVSSLNSGLGSSGASGKSQASTPSQPISASSPIVTAKPRPGQNVPQGSSDNVGGNDQSAGSSASNQNGENNGGNQSNASGSNTSESNQNAGSSGNVQSSQTSQNSQQQGSTGTPTTSPSNEQGGKTPGQSSGLAGGSGSLTESNTATNPVATPAPQPSSFTPSSSSANGNLSNASVSASDESVSASQASVSASNAAASASLASLSATNGAQSNSASAASASAVSAASSASAMSVSASFLSASASSGSTFSLTSSSSSPTSTNGGTPINLASHGLSGGQIAGIVLGSVFGLLLLLLLAGILLARRRRNATFGAGVGPGAAGGRVGRKLSDRWASGFSRTGGDYAALGAGAGIAGLGMAATGSRGANSINSNEWEEDRLSGGDGSGFFVVGGKRRKGGQSIGETQGDLFAESNSNSDAAVGGLAGFGAGIAAALGGRKRGRNSGKGREGDHQAIPTSSREADLADEDDRAFASDEDGDATYERRGLMSFGDVGDSSEMTQAGPSGWMQSPNRNKSQIYSGGDSAAAGAAVVAGTALGVRAMSSPRRGKRRNLMEEEYPQNNSNEESNWFAGGVAEPSRAARRGQPDHYTPEGSVGAGYRDRPMQSYGNLAYSSSPSKPSSKDAFGDGDLSNNPFDKEELLGAGVSGIGLGALAAGHRSSGMSQAESDNGHEDRYSGFISQGTPLLGPGASSPSVAGVAEGKNATIYSNPNRLSTIRSVGEFGEQGSLAPSTNQSGTGGTGSASGSGTRSGYGSVRTAPLYTSSAGPSMTGLQRFYTPSPSPGAPQDPFQDQSQLASIPDEQTSTTLTPAPALGGVAGFLGGLIPDLGGWTRSEYKDVDDDPQDNSIRPVSVGQRGQEKEVAETQSQRASVYNESAFDHAARTESVKEPSPTGSGQSSAPNSAPSHTSIDEAAERNEDPFEEDAATGGYTASVSNQSQIISSGNSRNGSRRSGQTMSTRVSRGNTSGTNSNSQSNSNTTSSGRRNQNSSGGSGSTGAASYNPSYLARQSTSSTRGVGTSSGSSRLAARGGGPSSSSRRRKEETDMDNESSLIAAQTLDSDGRSSRATAGGEEDLSRLSFDPGQGVVRAISSSEALVPLGNYYPSESLGAAVRRRAERELQEAKGKQGDDATSQPYPALGEPSTSALSPQWRQSPRVESASQRANANLLQQRSPLPESFTQTQESAGINSPRRTRLPDPEEARSQEDPQGEEEEDESNRLWPKFLRF